MVTGQIMIKLSVLRRRSSFSNFYWTSNESTFPAHSATRAIFVYFNQFGSNNGNNATAPKDLSGGGPVRAVREWTDF